MKIFSIMCTERQQHFIQIAVSVFFNNAAQNICFAYYFERDNVESIIKEFQESFPLNIEDDVWLLERGLSAITKKNSRFHKISLS